MRGREEREEKAAWTTCTFFFNLMQPTEDLSSVYINKKDVLTLQVFTTKIGKEPQHSAASKSPE